MCCVLYTYYTCLNFIYIVYCINFIYVVTLSNTVPDLPDVYYLYRK